MAQLSHLTGLPYAIARNGHGQNLAASAARSGGVRIPHSSPQHTNSDVVVRLARLFIDQIWSEQRHAFRPMYFEIAGSDRTDVHATLESPERGDEHERIAMSEPEMLSIRAAD